MGDGLPKQGLFEKPGGARGILAGFSSARRCFLFTIST
jgi:hypothetical protein